MSRWLARAGVGAIAAATLVALQAATALAAGTSAPRSSEGHDVSWPQCGATLPRDDAFGIVGVNGGRAWSANPCLLTQYRWASRAPRMPEAYVNTADPAPQSDFYWPQSGAHDPALCIDATSTTDPGCAYDYGWHAAAAAYAATTGTLGPRDPVGYWWLDVETVNTWNGDIYSNAADVQGSIDYLMSQNVAGVGVYSSPDEWAAITGGYSTQTQAAYATVWAPEFTSSTGIATSPAWVAGVASSHDDAQGACATSFLGTTTWLVQYVAGGRDVDFRCGAAAPGSESQPPEPPPATPTVPSAPQPQRSTGIQSQ